MSSCRHLKEQATYQTIQADEHTNSACPAMKGGTHETAVGAFDRGICPGGGFALARAAELSDAICRASTRVAASTAPVRSAVDSRYYAGISPEQATTHDGAVRKTAIIS